MSDISLLKYTSTHEWVKLEGDSAIVGITDHAQKEISDVVFIELPKQGKVLKAKDSAMVIESVKAAFDIYAPLSGTVLEANQSLSAHPENVNQSPYEKGWLFKLRLSAPDEVSQLMDLSQYEKSCQSH